MFAKTRLSNKYKYHILIISINGAIKWSPWMILFEKTVDWVEPKPGVAVVVFLINNIMIIL